LISQGADVNAVSKEGDTALSIAARQGDVAVVDILLNAGAKTEISPEEDKSPLILSSANGFGEVVGHLIKYYDASANSKRIIARSLASAIGNGHGAPAKLLLDTGAALELSPDRFPEMFFLSASKGDVDLLEIFLKRHVDINAVDAEGRTALMIASEKGNYDAVRFLLLQGVYVNTRDKNGYTALSFAARARKADIAGLLLNNQCLVDVKSISGSTPLMLAVGSGAKDVVLMLIAFKANLELTNKYGETALALAVKRDDRPIAKILLEHGANPYLAINILDNASQGMKDLIKKYKSTRSWLNKIF